MTATPKLSTGGMATEIPLENESVALDPLIAKPASFLLGPELRPVSTANGKSNP
jgi:hypothetical protein